MQAEQGTLGAKLAIIRGALTLVGRQVDRVGARFLLDQELDKNLDGDEDGSAQQALSHKQWPWDWKLLAASREKRDGERHHCTILSRAEVVQAAAFLQEQQGDGDGRTETSSGDASDAEAVLAAARVFIGTRTVVGRGRCCSEHKKETLVCWPDLLSPPPPPTHPTPQTGSQSASAPRGDAPRPTRLPSSRWSRSREQQSSVAPSSDVLEEQPQPRPPRRASTSPSAFT